MSKLFTPTDKHISNLTLEQYKDYFSQTEVISNESMNDFMFKIKDAFVATFNKLAFTYNDKAVAEILAMRYQVVNKAKHLDYTTASENVTSKPESFKGKYVNYVGDLKEVALVAKPQVKKLLSDFKIIIASFINEANDNKVGKLHGIDGFKKVEKDLAKLTEEISKYFPVNTGKSKGSFRELLHTFDDFGVLFDGVGEMDKVLNYEDVKVVDKEVDGVRELIDVLIDMTNSGSVVLNNEDHKKDLVYATYVSGKYVEFFSYLFTNLLVFYGTYKNNCQDLMKL